MTLLSPPKKKAVGLVAQTDALLKALRARQESDLRAFAKHNYEATKLLVYVGFGFNLMHRRVMAGATSLDEAIALVRRLTEWRTSIAG